VGVLCVGVSGLFSGAGGLLTMLSILSRCASRRCPEFGQSIPRIRLREEVSKIL
jgi:hypothetical protein